MYKTILWRSLWLYQQGYDAALGSPDGRPRPNHYLVLAPELDLCVFVP